MFLMLAADAPTGKSWSLRLFSCVRVELGGL
jgi:hypothetical protein